ncbi:TetR/AcrR family transcriptional regulator [Lentilactobacillus buchneri]|uniref:Transcriptional regulator, TetR family n=1 Tax=Lentilactobacillus buchneri subsp. silagei CD034 TaxID=1071400 RepID=J9W642_LENBU|nr:TetR/AcrR family transcriptional regulator [Lentilactobacillus buchneri]MCC6102159.1 TetR/AcrR family transcriptional regulator [Lactobacillus sp.]AFR99730.1 transcriptional regulator, TetR family [Lentilactobacillus buchneri subsp. silagei CD034]MCT2901840.1 TetR/AcrR family transcriptional regulator [Lentilactobacillus buchneri]MCT3543710.1 TetR/AcrR family transcriptional regulator [Lentilactobacillus buchneri]MCT3545589.1 TetR/AcrR family transcriptional regulator [Lentilactobacillus bu
MLNGTELKLFADANVLNAMTDKQVKILLAAIEVFAEKGYANASTKEIATKAGVSEGNIFSKFKNKRGLLNAIIEPVINSIFPAVLTEFKTDQLPLQFVTLHAFVDSLVRDRIQFLKDNAAVLKIFVSEVLYNETVRKELLTKFPPLYWHNINKNLNQLKDNHLIVNWENLEILKIIWSVVGGVIIGYLLFNQPLEQREITHIIDALVKSLAR